MCTQILLLWCVVVLVLGTCWPVINVTSSCTRLVTPCLAGMPQGVLHRAISGPVICAEGPRKPFSSCKLLLY